MKERKDEGWQPFRCARMIRFVAGSAMKFLGTSRLSSIFYNLISRFVLIIKWNDWFYKSILEWSLTRFTLLEFIQIVFFLFFMIRFDEPSFHLSPIFFILIYNRFFILILSVCVYIYHDKLDVRYFSRFQKKIYDFPFLCGNFDIRKNNLRSNWIFHFFAK